MNRYVKIKGHNNWFLVLSPSKEVGNIFTENMKERIVRGEIHTLHNKNTPLDYERRLVLAACLELDYNDLAKKYGTLLIRPIGSYMLLQGSEVVEEVFDTDFPVDDLAGIVVCENDKEASTFWISYLKKRFPDQKIVVINFFDLRSDAEIKKYFSKAKYITFSTTFSDFGWFKKVCDLSSSQQIIGYCSDKDKWEEAKKLNPTVEIVTEI